MNIGLLLNLKKHGYGGAGWSGCDCWDIDA